MLSDRQAWMPAFPAKHTEADLVLNDLTDPDSILRNLTTRHSKNHLFPLQETQAVMPPTQQATWGHSNHLLLFSNTLFCRTCPFCLSSPSLMRLPPNFMYKIPHYSNIFNQLPEPSCKSSCFLHSSRISPSCSDQGLEDGKELYSHLPLGQQFEH